MQAAYWASRNMTGPLGGVAAHLYAEFDGYGIDLERLRSALSRLCCAHGMLRLRISEDGYQSVDAEKMSLPLEVEDLQGKSQDMLDRHLHKKREIWTLRQLDLTAGEVFALGLSLLPRGQFRLHVDTDMIAIDPSSFLILMEDLACFYDDLRLAVARKTPGYFDWLAAMSADKTLTAKHKADRQWWRERLEDIPPAPSLPMVEDRHPISVRSERLEAWVSPEDRRSLECTARNCRMTLSTLMMGLFAAALGRTSKSSRFRLNVPMFWRMPAVRDVERIIGEFSNVLILDVDITAAGSFKELCEQLGRQMADLLAHSSYPGVSVMRDLSRHKGEMQSAPIVFTAGLDLPRGALFSERVDRIFGKMNWVISQAPQVAIDAQVAVSGGGIFINWDVRLDALPESWVKEFFDAYAVLVRDVAARPQTMEGALSGWLDQRGSVEAPGEVCVNSSTEKMLTGLLERLLPGISVDASSDICEAGVTPASLADLVAFFNRYVPASQLTLEDVEHHRTPQKIADLIRQRSKEASEDIAHTFLKAMKRSA